VRKYLVELRESRSLSQQNVAGDVGITAAYYSLIECGSRDLGGLKSEMIGKLACVFGVNAPEIFQMEAEYQAGASYGAGEAGD